MARIGIKDFDTAGLWVRDLAVTYRNGVTALKSASFAVPKGSIAALVGVNGAGKSTLFKAIMGFLPAAKGEIGILGQGVKASLKQGLVAYVPQAEEVGGCRRRRPARRRHNQPRVSLRRVTYAFGRSCYYCYGTHIDRAYRPAIIHSFSPAGR